MYISKMIDDDDDDDYKINNIHYLQSYKIS